MTPACRFPAMSHRVLLPCLLLACTSLLAPSSSQARCVLHDQSTVALPAWRAAGFPMPGDGPPGAQAVALVPCLADGAPSLRDGIEFAGLSEWLRGGKLEPASLRALVRTATGR